MAGQLRVDEITDEAGTGSPSFPQGIQPNSLGTGTPGAGNFLRGDGAWEAVPPGSTPGQLELLQEDIFTTSGTFTKATGFDDDDTVMIFLVGGGGSGAASFTDTGNISAVGGMCGNGVVVASRYANMPSSSFTLTIGSGGIASTQTSIGSIVGNNGGTTVLLNTPEGIVLFCEGGSGGNRTGVGAIDRDNRKSWVSIIDGLGSSRTAAFDELNRGAISNVGTNSAQPHGARGAIQSEFASIADQDKPRFASFPRQVFGSGGSAARVGATNITSYNPKVPALFATGGAGSGTADGANATGIGGGGGASARQNTTATSGAGANGAMVVRYYRGRVSTFQVISEVER